MKVNIDLMVKHTAIKMDEDKEAEMERICR